MCYICLDIFMTFQRTSTPKTQTTPVSWIFFMQQAYAKTIWKVNYMQINKDSGRQHYFHLNAWTCMVMFSFESNLTKIHLHSPNREHVSVSSHMKSV